MILLISPVALAWTTTITPGYSGSTVLNSPVTWGSLVPGPSGFTLWPTSPYAYLSNGSAGYDVWTESNNSGGAFGSNPTYAGFIVPLSPDCNTAYATQVVFTWEITWNYTEFLSGPGLVTNDFYIYGAVGTSSGGAQFGYNTYYILQVTSVVPTSNSGGATAALYSVTVSVTGSMTSPNTYYLTSTIVSDVEADSTAPTGQAASELNVGSGHGGGGGPTGNGGATLEGIAISAPGCV